MSPVSPAKKTESTLYMKTYELLIAGCGVSGKAAARLSSFLKKEYVLLDEKNVDVPLLDHPPALVLENWKSTDPLPCRFKTAILSPGIRTTNPLYAQICAASDRVMGELEFAASFAPCPMAGITGTNGKTTTTELTTALFQAAGVRAEAAGNIGNGLSDAVIAALKGETQLLIVEVSSFQLEHTETFPMAAAALLNLASDHIDRHGSMEEYARIKFIMVNSAECAVLNTSVADHPARDQKNVITFSATDKNADLNLSDDGVICYKNRPVFDFKESQLKGSFNAENIMAALALLAALKGENILFDESEKICNALRGFKADHHRAECFLEKNGIRYVDDSKATNPHAVIAALQLYSAKDGKNIRLLLGGLDKDMDFKELIPYLGAVEKVYLTGSCRERIRLALEGIVPLEMCRDFTDAAQKMCADAQTGEVVMLSPATASMDEFRNYRERGDHFKKIVAASAK